MHLDLSLPLRGLSRHRRRAPRATEPSADRICGAGTWGATRPGRTIFPNGVSGQDARPETPVRRGDFPSFSDERCPVPDGRLPLARRATAARMSPRPRVFATRRLPGRALERLAERTALAVWEGDGAPPSEAIAAGAREAAGLLCLLTDRVDEPLLRACPRLRAISSCSVGVDHIDLAAAAARGIPVGHTPGVLVETTADLAFGLLLAAARR